MGLISEKETVQTKPKVMKKCVCSVLKQTTLKLLTNRNSNITLDLNLNCHNFGY